MPSIRSSDSYVYRFIGEETFAGGAKTEFTHEPTWIVDPIGIGSTLFT